MHYTFTFYSNAKKKVILLVKIIDMRSYTNLKHINSILLAILRILFIPNDKLILYLFRKNLFIIYLT